MERPLLYMLLLVLPAALILSALIWHSYKYHGGRVTTLYFIYGALYYIGRENLNAMTVHYDGKPQYFFNNPLITIGKAPLPAIIGWFITGLLGWFLAERILKGHPRLENRLFPTMLLTGVFVSSMSLAVEGTGIHLGWWSWPALQIYYAEGPFTEYLLDCPFVALQGWFLTVLTFMVPFCLVECSAFRRKGAARYLWFLIVPANAFLLSYVFSTARFILVGLLVFLALFNRLEFDYSPGALRNIKKAGA
ncbi:MAG: hypothetical protein Kow0090_16350 [Myxococcota bacterium]